jgi:bifunctional non-homologous end joining protein LigD
MAAAPQSPARIEPMLARAGSLPRDPANWSFEIKWDGVRAIAHIDAERVRVHSRNLNDITRSYPELAAPPAPLRAHPDTVLDGEIIAFDADGRPSFGRLQQRMHVIAPGAHLRSDVPISYVVFDLLRLDGEDITGLAYRERRTRLEALDLASGPWQVPDVHPGKGRELLAATRARGLEGIVAKRLDSPYRPGARTGGWLKLKHTLSQELVIGGWLPGEGRRSERIGALLMGHFVSGRLVFDGRVGTGFSEATLLDLAARLAPLVTPASPFDPRPKLPVHAVWVAPELVAEIAFTERTREGLMRAPSFKGLRTDKDAREVVLEEPAGVPAAPSASMPGQVPAAPSASMPGQVPAAPSASTPGQVPAAPSASTPGQVPQTSPGATNGRVQFAGRTLTITNHDKVLYPKTGFTKGELIDYYAAVAPVVLGHLAGRALTLKRYPNGVDGPFFYEKNSPTHRPDWVPTAHVGDIDYTLAEEPATLVWLGNLADIELHTSLSRAERPESPTLLAFDLDPGPPAGLLECAEVALVLRGLFTALGMVSCVKTSGGKGLQVYVPLNRPDVTYAQTKPLARRVAELLEGRLGDLVISRMTRSQRTGRVFVDWSQNDTHKTTVTVYSLRATPAPSVSTPLSWEELTAARDASDPGALRFGPAAVLDRIATRGDLFAPVLSVTQTLPALT